MGGMGTIHADNDNAIYEQNHTMTQNILKVISLPGNSVTCLFYASSACVYPESLQTSNEDVSLQEACVFDGALPRPQGLYGLEKLSSELLILQYSDKISVRIARYHNVFGPGGCWNNGREKAPAALIRKALACRRLMDEPGQIPDFEIWGDGTQRRSFLYIDDAVDASLKLLFSSCSSPVNIGSDRPVTIKQLAAIALDCANAQANFIYDTSKPSGVVSRNSNNDFARSTLKWSPSTSLEEGMAKTYSWIKEQMDRHISPYEQSDDPGPSAELRALLSSRVVNLDAERITFAIILPITSRGSADPYNCLHNLSNFIRSLKEMTWRDVYCFGSQSFRYTLYLAIDEDDWFLRHENKAYQLIREAGIHETYIRQVFCNHKRGHVCAIWRQCAQQAYTEGCDYFVLMGDDIMLKDEGWMRKAQSSFCSLAERSGLPFGLGCVAFTDDSFPGMPTFPIIHKTHMEIFKGEIVPEVFTNQDGDPFLFQLYRRWGTSTMFSCRLTNDVGGSDNARYVKEHVTNWSLAPLTRATAIVSSWLKTVHKLSPAEVASAQKITLDIIIPCYRVSLSILSSILSLKSPPPLSLSFIIIIDDPTSPHIPALLHKYSMNPNIRIRINKTNLGASYSRNRGLSESAADWVHFLDDDIDPSENLIFEVERAIRENPSAAGFVCNTQFPLASSVFTTAVHLAGVTYFWDIATKISVDVPWGVTANLVSRRVLLPGTSSKGTTAALDSESDLDVNMDQIPNPTLFSLSYPKTGGGEDIDYCLSQRSTSLSLDATSQGFLAAPNAIVTHPWWNGGRRSYWRFYMWSVGDGHLIHVYPELSYWDHAPNSAECFFICFLAALLGACMRSHTMIKTSAECFIAVFVANILHDLYRHLIRHPDRNKSLNTTLWRYGLFWILAVIESALIRMFSELGRLRGCLARRELGSVGKRFDWFVGRVPGNGPMKEERRNSVERVVLATIVLVTLEILRVY